MKEIESYEIDIHIRIKGDIYHLDQCGDKGYYLVTDSEETELPVDINDYFSALADEHIQACLLDRYNEEGI